MEKEFERVITPVDGSKHQRGQQEKQFILQRL